MKLIRWIEDQILYHLQRRCDHPGNMVAADILEGCADGIEVKYCRRCGSIKTDWHPNDPTKQFKFITLEHWWRNPNPNLWRG